MRGKRRWILLLTALFLLAGAAGRLAAGPGGPLAPASAEAAAEPAPATAYESLAPGDSGDEVAALQARLAALGFAVGEADGQYGEKTARAVRTVQALAGLEVTGTADPDTQALIWGLEVPDARLDQSRTGATPTPAPEDGAGYILNRNTGKFHHPWCSAVEQMKEKNKVYFNGTREEAIEMGYVPCKLCNP